MQVLLYLPHKDLYIVCTADTQPDERYRERSFELFDEQMNPIESTPHPYMTFYIKASNPIKAGDIIRFK